MASLNAADTIEEQPDKLHPDTELEYLDKTQASDPLLVKVSELIYRQCQKDKEREKIKETSKGWTLIVSCLFIVLMIALIVSKNLQDKVLFGHLVGSNASAMNTSLINITVINTTVMSAPVIDTTEMTSTVSETQPSSITET